MKENEIPKGERHYLIPGRTDVFEQDGEYYLYMGKWAGWMTAEKIHISENGTVSALSGKLNTEAAVAAAGRILRSGNFFGASKSPVF